MGSITAECGGLGFQVGVISDEQWSVCMIHDQQRRADTHPPRSAQMCRDLPRSALLHPRADTIMQSDPRCLRPLRQKLGHAAALSPMLIPLIPLCPVVRDARGASEAVACPSHRLLGCTGHEARVKRLAH